MLLVIIKVLALLFTGLVIIKSYLSFRRHEESLVMFLFWSVTWVMVMVVAFYPEVVTAILGERRVGIGTLVGMGVVFVYFVIYRVYVKADRIEKRLASLIQDQALKEVAPSQARGKKRK